MRYKLSVRQEIWPASQTLRIAGKVFDRFETVYVEISNDNAIGRGEGAPAFYLGETAWGVLEQIESIRFEIETGIDRAQLQEILPPGGARNAIDCALWDLELKTAGTGVWDSLGIKPRKLQTQYSLTISPSPQEMAADAKRKPSNLLKAKLDSDRPIERLEAIRAVRPDARIAIDANQGWTMEFLRSAIPAMEALGVVLIEQPLPRGGDEELEGFSSPIPICADESCLHMGDFETVSKRYDGINIKLDKTGGLTHALSLLNAARKQKMLVMVGCFGGSSLAIAPACLVAAQADITDLDGSLWLKSDRSSALQIQNGEILPFGPELWG